MNVRPMLRGALWTAVLLFVILLITCAVWLALAEAGDHAGSQGAKGIALVASVCLSLDVMAIVVLLALAEIGRPERPEIDRPDRDAPRL